MPTTNSEAGPDQPVAGHRTARPRSSVKLHAQCGRSEARLDTTPTRRARPSALRPGSASGQLPLDCGIVASASAERRHARPSAITVSGADSDLPTVQQSLQGERAQRARQVCTSCSADEAARIINDLRRAAAGCYHYYHLVHVWVMELPGSAEMTELRRNCDEVNVHPSGTTLFRTGRKPDYLYNPPYRYRIDMVLPRIAALEILSKRKRASVTRTEFVQDLTFDSECSLRKLYEAYNLWLVQRYQYGNQRMSWVNKQADFVSTSTGRRRGLSQTYYIDSHCYITGEIFCLHHEIRVEAGKKLRAMGIRHVSDLLEFDIQKLFSEQVQFRAIDIERLGRVENNRRDNSRRQKPVRARYGKNSTDWNTGHRLWHILAADLTGVRSVQTLLQNYGNGPFVRSITVEGLSANHV